MACHNSFFSSTTVYACSQLRPVTYRGLCDLTHVPSSSYSQIRLNRAPYSRFLSCSSLVASGFWREPQIRWPFDSALAPLLENPGIRACTVVNTSVAKAFRGSETSTASHSVFPSIQDIASVTPSIVPRSMITVRGGNDFFVGTIAASSTLTVGISLASCTFANSYCWVSSSYTVSWILVCRYKSAYATPNSGNFRMEG